MSVALAGITYGAAKAALARVVEKGLCADDPRVLLRTNEATKVLMEARDPVTGGPLIPVGSMATYDVIAVGTTLLLPKQLANAIEVEVLNGTVNGQTDVRQGWYDNLVNPSTYVDPMMIHDNPLVDLFLVADPANPAVLRRKYDYPNLSPNATVRVTGARRYIPITVDSDYLLIQNVLAVKFCIQAIEMYEDNALEQGDMLFKKAMQLLSDEIKTYQMDPRNTAKRKAAYDADLVNFRQGSFGYIRARIAHEVMGSLAHGKSELNRLVEQAEMRLMDKGLWMGALEEFTAPVVNGHILFPARVKSVLAANIGGAPLDIRSIFFKYQKDGPLMECACANILHDEGEVYFSTLNQYRRKYSLDSSASGSTSGVSDSASVTPPSGGGTTIVPDVLYVGSNARFVAIAGGLALEVKDSNGNWIREWEQTE